MNPVIFTVAIVSALVGAATAVVVAPAVISASAWALSLAMNIMGAK